MEGIKKILVTGADSQLGKTLRELQPAGFEIDFYDKQSLDITNANNIDKILKRKNYDYCFNFAAYTNVEQAEIDTKKCFEINAEAVKKLAELTAQHHTALVHISTDYVFDGQKKTPYTETDIPHPLNQYGKSKLEGEKWAALNPIHYIIRTSWLYSSFNRNFVKTVLQLAQNKDTLQLVNDQTGSPTYAPDLIDFILHLVRFVEQPKSGIYHFSNSGETTWFEFGKEILSLRRKQIALTPVTSVVFQTKAARPAYSVLSYQKIKKVLNYTPRNWREGLKEFLIKNKI